MTNRYLLLRLLLIFGVVAITFMSEACAAGPSRAPAAKTDQAGNESATNASTGVTQQDSQSAEDRTLIAVSKAIRRAKLTDRPDECLAYRFDDKSSEDAYVVEVRENHRHASCGGDPQTQPRLFTVRVNKKTQAMSTDAGSPGQFHPLEK